LKLNQMPTKCKNPECLKGASYNFPGKTARLFCKTHAEPGMVSTRSDTRICIHPDHEDKAPRASFNLPDQPKPLYCKAHATDGMINFNNRNSKCKSCNLKQPSYGLAGKKATHCSKCATDEMVDLVSNLCTSEKCQKNATYGIRGGKASRCKTHADSDMIDVKNSKCEMCNKQPTFGKRSKATRCIDHKTDDMVDVRHKTEICKECTTRATFSLGEYPPTHCVKHKTEDMKDIISTMCLKCGKHQPKYNYKGVKPPIFCVGCALDNMVDVVNPMCKSCGLFMVTKKPHLCAYCKPSTTLRQKTKEMMVVTFLQEKGYEFIHNKSVGFVCGNYRPDIKIDVGSHLIIVEIDEDQHRQYDQSCEIARMLNIFQAEGLQCVFLRYNPDIFRVKGKAQKIHMDTRLKILEETIDRYIESPPDQGVSIYRIFYNNESGEYVEKYDLPQKYKDMF
jgi:hypothetical protein